MRLPLPLLDKAFTRLFLFGCLGLPLITYSLIVAKVPTVAHEVEVSGNVAATFHLEPNHNPKAGETAQVWFALTRKGGTIIPLSECDCQLFIYTEPRSETDKPLITPELNPISAEKYQGIPGTNVIFPQVGRYQLELVGKPKNQESFQPFKFNYSVTVL
ncbi:MAG: hypothetical protein WBA13_14355 [Microcoleaceae cyanobacterium]